MTLGEVIKQYRTKHKVTIQEFSDRAGLSKGYISMLERNRHPGKDKPIVPSIETIIKVANTIGVTLGDLLDLLDADQLIEIPESNVPDYSFINESMSAVEIMRSALKLTGYFDEVEFTDDELMELIQYANFLIMKRIGSRRDT